MKTGVKISDIMKKKVVTVKPTDSCDKALKYMVDFDIGCVIVTESKKPIGIVTDSNLLERVFYDEKDPKKIKIKDIMSHPLRTVEPDLDLEEASRIMRDLNLKRLPVFHENKLVGLVTEADIISISPALFEIIAEAIELRCGLPEKSMADVGHVCETFGEIAEE